MARGRKPAGRSPTTNHLKSRKAIETRRWPVCGRSCRTSCQSLETLRRRLKSDVGMVGKGRQRRSGIPSASRGKRRPSSVEAVWKPLLLSGRLLLSERTQWTVSVLMFGFVKIRVNSWTVNPDKEAPADSARLGCLRISEIAFPAARNAIIRALSTKKGEARRREDKRN